MAETSSGVEGYFFKITGGSFGMFLPNSTAVYEESLTDRLSRLACLLAVGQLPSKALRELSETLADMFAFYNDESKYQTPKTDRKTGIKPKISSEVVHPTFSLDDE